MSNYKYVINPSHLGIADFIKQIPQLFDTTGSLIHDGRNKVRLITAPDGLPLVVKRYKKPLFHQRFDYTFIRKSKNSRAYDYALQLLNLGIDTPAPIASIEEYKMGLFYQGYFISTQCNDSNLMNLTADDCNADIIKALALFMVKMHNVGFLHGDTNLSNILYRKEDSDYHFTVIDINRSVFTENPSQDQCLHNFMRLTHNRSLCKRIVTEYALIRNWDVDHCVATVMTYIDKLERKENLKYSLKGKKA